MLVNFKQISKENYYQLNYNILFENKLLNRNFGVISNENKYYKFSWQSDIIKPAIIEIGNNVFSIGIDLNYVVLDLKESHILLNLELTSFLLETLVRNNIIYVITEMEIYLVSAINYNIIKTIDLPDIFKEIIFEKNIVIVRCFGEQEISIL